MSPANAELIWGNDKPLKFQYKMEICELTQTEPYYDCDYKWLIVKIDANMFLIPNTNRTINAMAYWGYNFTQYVDIPIEDNEKYEALIILGNNFVDNCYEYDCKPLFMHEVEHVWCYCNWHKDMKSAYVLDNQLDFI